MLGGWRGVPIFAIVIEPEPDFGAGRFGGLDAFREQLIVLGRSVFSSIGDVI